MQVKEIMSRIVEVIDADSPIQSAAEMMKNSDIGMLPVREGDRLVGILSDRDITVRATASGLDPTKNGSKRCRHPGCHLLFRKSEHRGSSQADASKSAAPLGSSKSTEKIGRHCVDRGYSGENRGDAAGRTDS